VCRAGEELLRLGTEWVTITTVTTNATFHKLLGLTGCPVSGVSVLKACSVPSVTSVVDLAYLSR
jgi:hypothetical protein